MTAKTMKLQRTQALHRDRGRLAGTSTARYSD